MIYLDNCATTKVLSTSIKVLEKFNSELFYNPSSVYTEGVSIKNNLKSARQTFSGMLNANADEIIFTSGATESNNLCVQGVISGNKKSEYIFNAGEHSSVYNTANFIKQKGYTVHFVGLLADGQVDLEHLVSLVNQNTVLVSIMHVSNETGAVNDLKTISERVKQINNKTYFHADGVQAFTKIKVNVKALGVDMYTASSHKIHGPKGAGLLYVKKPINLKPIMFGGGQEGGDRVGTENVAGIMAFENSAKKMLENMTDNYEYVKELKQDMLSYIEKNVENIKINSQIDASFSPYILNLSIKFIKGEILLHMLQKEGILISTGSSCHSNSKRSGNRVLEAMGVDKRYIAGTIRISFSFDTTKEEVETASRIIVENINKLRKMIR
jgi:cysteine desulfurase